MVSSPMFPDVVRQIMPQVITILQSSEKAPKVHPQHTEILNPSKSSSEEKKKEREDNKELLGDFRKDMEKMDFVTTDGYVKETVSASEDDDDSFVIVDSPARPKEATSRKSILDILPELGFNDTRKNMKLVEKHKDDIDKILDELTN